MTITDIATERMVTKAVERWFSERHVNAGVSVIRATGHLNITVDFNEAMDLVYGHPLNSEPQKKTA